MKKALIITGNLVQDHEFIYPYYRLQEAGFEVDVAIRNKETVHGIIGSKVEPTRDISGINPDDYQLLALPGGAKLMEKLRQDQEALDTIKAFYDKGTIIASICHAAQLLISAGIVKGKKISGYYSIKDDINNAGAEYVDAPAVVSGTIVSSPHYKHLAAWMKETLALFEEHEKRSQ